MDAATLLDQIMRQVRSSLPRWVPRWVAAVEDNEPGAFLKSTRPTGIATVLCRQEVEHP